MRVLYINTNPSISSKIVDDSYDNGVYFMEKNSTEVSFSHRHPIIILITIIITRLKPRKQSIVCSSTGTRYRHVIDDASMSIGVLVPRPAPSSTAHT